MAAQGHSDINFAMTISDSTSTCDMDMGFSRTLTGVTFARPANADDGVCPLSGSVSMSGQVSIACTGENGNQAASESWIVNATFNGDGTMDVEAQSGNTVWTYNGPTPCGNYENPI